MSQTPFTLPPPKLLLAATLLFWGIATGQWMIAIPLAVALETPRFYSHRIHLDLADLRRAGQLTSLLAVGALITAFNTNEGLQGFQALMQPGVYANQTEALKRMTQTAVAIFQWLPIIFYPMAWIAAWSVNPSPDWRAMLWFHRTFSPANLSQSPPPKFRVLPLYPFFLVCLASSSASLVQGPWFLLGCTALSAWACWVNRNPATPKASWIANFSLIATAAFILSFLYQIAERKANELYLRWIQQMVQNAADPHENRTAIGSIGRIKNSGRTLFRVKDQGPATPSLLREGSYSTFKSPSWYATKKNPGTAAPLDDGTTWRLSPHPKPQHRSVTISLPLPARKGLLPLPNGASELHNLPVSLLETNRLGFAHVSDSPGFIEFTALFSPGHSLDAPPDADDLSIPDAERPALSRTLATLPLDSLSNPDKVQRIDKMFNDHFRYSLYLQGPPNRSTNTPTSSPIADFLERTRSGHCEYFATATVLLLRQLGIPARYAIGFSVQEKIGAEFRVRDRHAHAWCLAFLDGEWRDVDTTPASWLATEQSQSSWWEPIVDLLSTASYEFTKWRWGQSSVRPYLNVLVWSACSITLVLFLIKKRGSYSPPSPPGSTPQFAIPGTDSELYRIESSIALRLGAPRPPQTPLAHWLSQAEQSPQLPNSSLGLHQAVQLHYRYRFDPNGITRSERDQLRSLCLNWIASTPPKPQKDTLPGRTFTEPNGSSSAAPPNGPPQR